MRPDERERAEREVRDLHRFFEAWFRGELERSDEALARLTDALDESFVLFHPEGAVFARDALVQRLRAAWGVHADDGISIRIEGLATRSLAPGLVLATYEEWHEREGEETGRRSSALLRAAEGAPEGLAWIHLHESWLGRPE